MIIDMNMVLIAEIKKALMNAKIPHVLETGPMGRDADLGFALLKLGTKNGLAAFLEEVVEEDDWMGDCPEPDVEVPSVSRGTVKLTFGIKSSSVAVWINGEVIVPIDTSIDEARSRLQDTENVTDTILVKTDKVEMRRVFKDFVISKNGTQADPWPAGTIEDLLHLLKIHPVIKS